MDEEGRPAHPGDMRAQCQQALANLEAVLDAPGLALANVLRLNYYTTDMDRFFEAYEVFARRLMEAECRTTSTLLGVSRLAFPNCSWRSRPPRSRTFQYDRS